MIVHAIRISFEIGAMGGITEVWVSPRPSIGKGLPVANPEGV
jgi:hypothetical protein